MRNVVLACLVVCLAWTFVNATAEDNPLSTTFTDWLKHPAIDYARQTVADPVAELRRQIQSGQVKLKSEGASGYLHSLLDALNIPISSQIALFANDSVQARRINPKNPRTLFFNDSVVVGWVRGGFIEIAAQDPRQGVVFYILDSIFDGGPSIGRRDECLMCHYSYSTAGVPGMVVRSTGQFNVTHRVPLEERWGGWYVTGRLGTLRHLGNLDSNSPYDPRSTDNLNWTTFDRKFDATGYLSTQSDVAALMVFEHQMHMMNLLSRMGWEVRVAEYQKQNRAKRAADEDTPIPVTEAALEVVDYMLFIEEASIPTKIEGNTKFAEEFAARGPKDRKGRTLRQLRLQSRLMQYPCSYMIYSAEFDSLPPQAKNAIYQRLWSILSGAERTSKYARLLRSDRVAITEILKDTKKDLPSYFQAAAVR
jgi:hypothetical protein